jgi:hypothetical protein
MVRPEAVAYEFLQNGHSTEDPTWALERSCWIHVSPENAREDWKPYLCEVVLVVEEAIARDTVASVMEGSHMLLPGTFRAEDPVTAKTLPFFVVVVYRAIVHMLVVGMEVVEVTIARMAPRHDDRGGSWEG